MIRYAVVVGLERAEVEAIGAGDYELSRWGLGSARVDFNVDGAIGCEGRLSYAGGFPVSEDEDFPLEVERESG